MLAVCPMRSGHMPLLAELGRCAGVRFYRHAAPNGACAKADVPAQSTNSTAQVTDPAVTNSPQRFYRVVTPPWP